MLNKVILIGNLGNVPTVRPTANGSAVTTLSVATHEAWTTADGTRERRTEWHTVVVWGERATRLAAVLRKGRPVDVEGQLRTRRWTAGETERTATRSTRTGSSPWSTALPALKSYRLALPRPRSVTALSRDGDRRLETAQAGARAPRALLSPQQDQRSLRGGQT